MPRSSCIKAMSLRILPSTPPGKMYLPTRGRAFRRAAACLLSGTECCLAAFIRSPGARSRSRDQYQKVELTDAEAGPAALQRTVRICRYARRMFSRAAKNLLLAALAIALGLALGAVTKFGFGYDL